MPNHKYDWENYLPRIIELYKTSIPIRQIHQAIQDPQNGFVPSERAVYKKLTDERYPTDPVLREEFLRRHNIATWPSQICLNKKKSQQGLTSTMSPDSANTTIGTPSASFGSSSTPSTIQGFITFNLSTPNHQPQFHQFEPRLQLGTQASSSLNGESYIQHPSQETPDSQELPNFLPIQHPEESSAWGSAEVCGELDISQCPAGFFNTPVIPPAIFDEENDLNRDCRNNTFSLDHSPALPRVVEESTLLDGTGQTHIDDERVPASEYCNGQKKSRPTPLSSPSIRRKTGHNVTGGLRNSLHNRLRLGRPCTPESLYSTTTDDSGYGTASGRSTPFDMSLDIDHPRLITQFDGLHRVPCHTPHEPQPQDRGRDKPTCPNCQYSGIHNLSWLAMQMKLEVFQAELRLQGTGDLSAVYDITAVDKVGNTALHYAAAGGASYDYFHALIVAGVDPYSLNTAGQLFLHCLRPRILDTNSETYEADLSLFKLDLVNLLNTYQTKGAFRWRDNNGETPMDALSRRIIDHETQTHIFRRISDAGYPLEVSKKFHNSRASATQPLSSEDIVSHNRSSCRSDASFDMIQRKQNKAWEILGRASSEPSYVDPETGDNVLHALARLQMPRKHDVMRNLVDYISKDVVDLNLQNQDRDCPLAAFVRERPFHGVESDETGATMSKYLDAILWKDAKKTIPNKVNVNMRNWDMATPLYYAAIRGRPDSVRSLIEAGANVNIRIENNGNDISILQATINARAVAAANHDGLKVYLLNNVISYLEYANAVLHPSDWDEMALCSNSVRTMPI